MANSQVNDEFISSLSNRYFSVNHINVTAKLIENEFGKGTRFIVPVGLVGVVCGEQGNEYTVTPELLNLCPEENVEELFVISRVKEDFILFHALFETSNLILTLIDCYSLTDERQDLLLPIANQICKLLADKYGQHDINMQVIENAAIIPTEGSDTGVYCLLQIQCKLQNNCWLTAISEDRVQNFKLNYRIYYENLDSTTPTAPPLDVLPAEHFRFRPEINNLYPSLSRNHLNNFGSTGSITQDNYTNFVTKYYPMLHPTLKKHQVEAIEALSEGYDIICLLPTSYGKTLAMIAGILIKARQSNEKCVHLIVSPLISLCEEMVTEWTQQGLLAYHVTGGLDESTKLKAIYDKLPEGSVLHLLSSPELMFKGCLESFLRESNVKGFSIDEGHVVSLWSQDFRKDYGNIFQVRAYIKCPLAVFSATVTPAQLEDIKQNTGIRRENLKLVIVSPNRPEIFFDVEMKKPNFSGYLDLISQLAEKGRLAKKVVIFVGRKLTATELLLDFRMNLPNGGKVRQECPQYTVDLYTGSTSEATRRAIEQDFRKEDSVIRVLIATSAFGMGLNINGLHEVIIQDLPETFGEIMQLGGRASRDGKQGKCVIILPEKSTKNLAEALRVGGCIRKLVLNDFCTPLHQTDSVSFFEACKKCNCCINCRNSCGCLSLTI